MSNPNQSRGPLAGRKPQVSQQAPAPTPAPMSEVQSPDIAKAEQAIEEYNEAQRPQDEVPFSADEPIEVEVQYTFPGGKILKNGTVVADPVPPRARQQSLQIVRGPKVTDEQWNGLKERLRAEGVTFREEVGK